MISPKLKAQNQKGLQVSDSKTRYKQRLSMQYRFVIVNDVIQVVS